MSVCQRLDCDEKIRELLELNSELLNNLEMLLHSYEVHGFHEGWCDFKEATQEVRAAIAKGRNLNEVS